MITTEKEAIEALENFGGVLDNLRKNEKFNIFDAVGMRNMEIKHSAFLAWLLDPKANHGQGGWFLHAFLDALYDYVPTVQGVKPNRDILPLSRERLYEFADADDICVSTEQTLGVDDTRMDIYMRSEKLDISLIIENKTFTSTHDDQLQNYENKEDGKTKKVLVYLTPKCEAPKHENGKAAENWCVFDYGAIVNILKNFLSRRRSSIDAKLAYIIEDYIDMVDKNLLKDNRNIMEACKEIRRKHADALELLFAYSDSYDAVCEYIKENLPRFIPDIKWYPQRGRNIDFSTESIEAFYIGKKSPIYLTNGLRSFQMSLSCKDKITLSMWLCKEKSNEWSDADVDIHKIVAPNRSKGSVYCSLYVKTLMSEEQRYRKYENGELEAALKTPLSEFLKKLEELEMSLAAIL